MHAQEQWIPLPQDGMSLVMYVPASERERERLRRVVAEPFGGEMGTALGPTRGAAISSHAYRLTRCAVEHAAIRNARPNPCSWTSDPSAVWLGIIGTKNQKLSGSASRIGLGRLVQSTPARGSAESAAILHRCVPWQIEGTSMVHCTRGRACSEFKAAVRLLLP